MADSSSANPQPANVTRNGRLIRPEAIDEFRRISAAPTVRPEVVEVLRLADEEHQLEPAIMRIIGDVDRTPHGPTEIADIVSVHLHVEGTAVFGALVLKGKTWPIVKARDVSYQILRAAQLPRVDLLGLIAVGDIQDDVKRDLAFVADSRALDWLMLDRSDIARLLAAYKELCPNDGSWLRGEPCSSCGFGRRPARAPAAPFQILTLEDVSYAAAKRYAAHVLLPPGLDEAEIVSRTQTAVDQVRKQRYTRNEQVEAIHGNRDADVVFLFVYEDVADRPFANWICRALWISPALDPRWHPTAFGEPTKDPALRLDWNASYGVVSALLQDRQDKGTYLRVMDRYLQAAVPIVERASRLLNAGDLTPEREEQLSRLSAAIEDLPRPDDQKAAPHELAEIDNLFLGLEGDLMNLALPFGPLGSKTWPEPERRRWLALQAIEMFDRDIGRLALLRDAVR